MGSSKIEAGTVRLENNGSTKIVIKSYFKSSTDNNIDNKTDFSIKTCEINNKKMKKI
jgi:hypothetical protein